MLIVWEPVLRADSVGASLKVPVLRTLVIIVVSADCVSHCLIFGHVFREHM